ncbi:MAG: hypothetical protein PHS31_04150 [Victivallaceae bacterium]|nr:hypothetical protein [Victivallaceae bacterium]MDD4180827.1 hypothetical protein [Victivallaceae bacterium]
MKAQEAIKLLKENSVFWSKLGFFHDPPRFDENGEMIVFGNDFERFGKYHRDFTNAGIKIHTSILFSGWVGVDKYDYKLTDQVLNTIFKADKNIWYIPRIKLNVPLDWGKENPEDICVYYEGPRKKEKIRNLVNTEKHDILGYESPIGYYTAGAWNDDRPNVGGLISNQSFSSKKWLADASETLRRFIRHLEDGPYGNRILAYHIAYGVSGETCLWGRFGNPSKFGDYGISNRKAFFDWGMRKYKTLEKLRVAWKQPSLNAESCEPPPPLLRENCLDLASSFFRQDEKYKVCIDYDKFMGEVNASAIEHFGKIAKNASNGKAIGCFYGYLETTRVAYSGWLEIDRLLTSPYIDFLAAPKSYYRNAPGEPGGVLGPAQSVNRKKLWLDELDNRTHLCTTAESVCRTFEDTRSVMWREFSKNMAYGSGIWWMDLGGGWFDSPEILAEIAKIEKTKHQLNKQKGTSISEILLVTNKEAFYHSNQEPGLHRLLMQDFVREMHLSGSPVDMLCQSDLETTDLSRYKLICFLNAFKLDVKKWRGIEQRLASGTTLLWNYYVDNCEEITGFKLQERTKLKEGELRFSDGAGIRFNDIMVPLFEVVNQNKVEILANYSDNKIAFAQKIFKDRNNIFCALPVVKAHHLRVIAEDAGCHMYAPLDCTVYADNRFIGVFPHSDIDDRLCFKKPADFIDVETGEYFKQTRTISLKLNAKRHKVFIRKTPI